MRRITRLCQGIAERLDWRGRKAGPDYVAALLASGAGTLPETLTHML